MTWDPSLTRREPGGGITAPSAFQHANQKQCSPSFTRLGESEDQTMDAGLLQSGLPGLPDPPRKTLVVIRPGEYSNPVPWRPLTLKAVSLTLSSVSKTQT